MFRQWTQKRGQPRARRPLRKYPGDKSASSGCRSRHSPSVTRRSRWARRILELPSAAQEEFDRSTTNILPDHIAGGILFFILALLEIRLSGGRAVESDRSPKSGTAGRSDMPARSA